MAEVEEIIHSPTPLKTAWEGMKNNFLVPAAIAALTLGTWKALDVLDLQYHWTFASWGYAVLCVVAALVLVQRNHWTVKAIVQWLVPAMVLVATVAFVWKKTTDSDAALGASSQLVQMAESVKHAEDAKKAAEDRAGLLEQQLAVERYATQAATPLSPPAAVSPAKVRGYRAPKPWWWDLVP